MRFDGKVVLISGAGSGIGRATAIAFARAGADVVAIGRRPEPLDQPRRAGKGAEGRWENTPNPGVLLG